jgi:hypothetical protein
VSGSRHTNPAYPFHHTPRKLLCSRMNERALHSPTAAGTPLLFIPPLQKHLHMDIRTRNRFVSLWQDFCHGAELPITFEVGDGKGTEKGHRPPKGGDASSVTLPGCAKGILLSSTEMRSPAAAVCSIWGMTRSAVKTSGTSSRTENPAWWKANGIK